MTTSSNVQPVMTSDPSIPSVSDPSIRVEKSSSKSIHMLLIFFVLVAVVAIGVSVFLIMTQMKQNEENAARLKNAAEETKRINAQSYRSEEMLAADDGVTESADDNFMFLSLFTTPPGADVYKDGLFLGNTPIDQKRILKSDVMSDLVVVMDGYQIERRSISMSENFSDALTLEKKVIPIAGAPVKRPEEPAPAENGDAVVANRAVLINTAEPEADKPADTGKKGGKTGKSGTKKPTPAPAADTGIVLPD